MFVRQPGAVCMHGGPIYSVATEPNSFRAVCVRDRDGWQQDLRDRQQDDRKCWTASIIHRMELRGRFHWSRGYQRRCEPTNGAMP